MYTNLMNEKKEVWIMRKNYESPKVDIIYLMMGEEMLAGSDGGGTTQPIGAKAYDGDLDDFTDESMWGDEANENNE